MSVTSTKSFSDLCNEFNTIKTGMFKPYDSNTGPLKELSDLRAVVTSAFQMLHAMPKYSNEQLSTYNAMTLFVDQLDNIKVALIKDEIIEPDSMPLSWLQAFDKVKTANADHLNQLRQNEKFRQWAKSEGILWNNIPSTTGTAQPTVGAAAAATTAPQPAAITPKDGKHNH